MDYIITEANKFEEKQAKPYKLQILFSCGEKGKDGDVCWRTLF